jgi:hypothetical protein
MGAGREGQARHMPPPPLDLVKNQNRKNKKLYQILIINIYKKGKAIPVIGRGDP